MQVQPGLKFTLNYCFEPGAPQLSLEDCINKSSNFTTPEGKAIVFEEQDVVSACKEAIRSGPQIRNR
jgi:hypothetical protein